MEERDNIIDLTGIVHPNDTFFDSSRCTTTTMTTMTILGVSVVSSRASERRRYNGAERIALKLITPPCYRQFTTTGWHRYQSMIKRQPRD